jgi:hypothetical protein
MLTGRVEDNDRMARLNLFMRDLKRTHVSRYPLRVESDGTTCVEIYDDRFTHKPVLTLYAVDGNTYKIWSPMIVNEKFSHNNSDYHTRKSSDGAKIRRWLKEYAVPHSTRFISRTSYDLMTSNVYTWRNQYYGDIREAQRSIVSDDVLEDILNYIKTGVAYQSSKFNKFKDSEFIAKAEQHVERSKATNPTLHVLVNPDEMVSVNKMLNTWDEPENICTQLYDTLDDNYRSKIALLKMVAPKTMLGEVGVRIDTCNFWIYK